MTTNDTLMMGAAGAPVSDIRKSIARSEGAFAYHAVPIWRFMLFEVMTLGVYSLWWGYRSWKGIKLRDGSDIWPFARALFLPFTFPGLITDINLHRVFSGAERSHLGAWIGLGFFVTNMLPILPEPISLLAWFRLAFLFPVLHEMRALSSAETLASKASWGPRHIALALAIVLFWTALLSVSSRPPEPAPEPSTSIVEILSQSRQNEATTP